MHRILLGLLVLPLAAQPTKLFDSAPPVVSIDVYGLHRVSAERVLAKAGLRVGLPLPASKGDLEERIEELPQIVQARVEAACCSDEGGVALFVGVEERGAPYFALRSLPDGEILLDDDVVGTYRQFSSALARAARQGFAAEDLRRGHSFSEDPEARRHQQKFQILAHAQTNHLRKVLEQSADEEHRAIAAYVLGYVKEKRGVVNDLQRAMQDPDPDVRGNAMRALTALAVLDAAEPEQRIRVEPTWFVEMLHSVELRDRMRAVESLLVLTDENQEKPLSLLRERGLAPLREMALWNSLPHAVGPFTLLGRAAGQDAEAIEAAWTQGERREIVAEWVKSLEQKKTR
ncbi:MAG: HEAT repeat domain-containing protein [Bryobacterales bacterium]|nr:HEAT repeat domain-containing protein [Bryobacterales bacterium]